MLFLFRCHLLTFFALVLFGTNINAQTRKPLRDLTEDLKSRYLILKDSFATNKQIDERLQEQAIYALSYFPELKQIKITFKFKKSKSGIISTRPTIGSIFRRSSNRSYIVIVNDSTPGRVFPLFSGGGINGQVGIIGHELCHILYFQRKTGFGLLVLGVKHISTRFMDEFENKTDSVNIMRGFGYQLMDWKTYLDQAFKKMLPSNHKWNGAESVKRERYMSVESIRRVMAKSVLYKEQK
jgi:hypothetical protein